MVEAERVDVSLKENDVKSLRALRLDGLEGDPVYSRCPVCRVRGRYRHSLMVAI
jgi:hypothetical protein